MVSGENYAPRAVEERFYVRHVTHQIYVMMVWVLCLATLSPANGLPPFSQVSHLPPVYNLSFPSLFADAGYTEIAVDA